MSVVLLTLIAMFGANSPERAAVGDPRRAPALHQRLGRKIRRNCYAWMPDAVNSLALQPLSACQDVALTRRIAQVALQFSSNEPIRAFHSVAADRGEVRAAIAARRAECRKSKR
jgi:hypothetical protein